MVYGLRKSYFLLRYLVTLIFIIVKIVVARNQLGQATATVRVVLGDISTSPESPVVEAMTDTDILISITHSVDLDNIKKGTPVVAIPRSNGKKHTRTFTNTELTRYKDATSVGVAREYSSLPDDICKYDFIINIINAWRDSSMLVVEYDETSNQYVQSTTSRLYTTIRKRLNYQAKKTDNNASNIYERMTTKLVFDRLYTNKKFLYDTEDVMGWSYYSVLHNIYSPFSFYVYNFSHRLKADDNVPIHLCTKVKLVLPPSPNMFIIFHGRTVHSGAESKRDSLTSMSYAHDMRLFSYVSAKQKGKNWTSLRTHGKGKDEDGTVERRGIKLCGGDCLICKDHISNRKCDDTWVINVKDNFKTIPPNKRICGDLFKYGWEVWKGVDTRTTKYYTLKEELQQARIHKEWKRIDNVTNRKVFKVARGEYGQCDTSFPTINMFVGDIEQKLQQTVFRSIKDTECMLKKCSIISNDGFVEEQLLHRDYPNIE